MGYSTHFNFTEFFVISNFALLIKQKKQLCPCSRIDIFKLYVVSITNLIPSINTNLKKVC